MTDLKTERIIVTGGSKGLGRGIVNTFVANGAKVTVIARSKALLNEMANTNVAVLPGDVTDKTFINKAIIDIQPTLLILNAGATPTMLPLDEQDWDNFSAIWNTDVQAVLYGLQAALKTMQEGSKVIIVSSGAAVGGSPLSGGYAGAKRMLWFMAQYANEISKQRSLGIQFQAVLPMQIIADTDLGREAAGAYAKRRNMTIESFLAARNIEALSAESFATLFLNFLTDKSYNDGIAYGINSTGITKLQ